MPLVLAFSASAHAYPVAFPAGGESLPNGAYFPIAGPSGVVHWPEMA